MQPRTANDVRRAQAETHMRFNPQMVTLARECAGLTQRALADDMRIPQTMLSRYESGLAVPSGEHLTVMAETLGKPESYFFRRRKVYGGTGIYHRKRKRVSSGTLKQIHALLNEARIQASILSEEADIATDHQFYRLSRERFRTPEQAAREVRRLWQLPPGPILNVVEAVEAAGGVVFRTEFPTRDIDGVSQWPADDPGARAVFFINSEAPGDRQRFTLSHELAHAMLHHVPIEEDIEDEADRFAQEFLLPEDEIKEDLYDLTLERAAALKSYWKVSMAAIVVRAHRLGCINDRRYRYLNMLLNKHGFKMAEPVPIPPEAPALFDAIVSLHRRTLSSPDEELAAKLDMPLDEFQDRFGPGRQGLRLVRHA